MTLREILADNLRRLRQGAGMSQEDLADAAKIDWTYVSALERCRYGASIDVLERLAAALNVAPTELISNSGA
jgi:transcriptional regulator with XRE-family HTH domain